MAFYTVWEKVPGSPAMSFVSAILGLCLGSACPRNLGHSSGLAPYIHAFSVTLHIFVLFTMQKRTSVIMNVPSRTYNVKLSCVGSLQVFQPLRSFLCIDQSRDVRSPQSSHHSCANKAKQLSPGLGNLLSTRGRKHVLQSPQHGIFQHLLIICQTNALG